MQNEQNSKWAAQVAANKKYRKNCKRLSLDIPPSDVHIIDEIKATATEQGVSYTSYLLQAAKYCIDNNIQLPDVRPRTRARKKDEQ